MCSTAFHRGVAEVRAGRPPNFDTADQPFLYEAGRQFAAIAPTTMLITVNGKLNPKAEYLFLTVVDDEGIWA
jgi:hypothetical protein